MKKLIKKPPSRLGDREVVNVETIEGLKLDFDDDDWILFRPSGTAPVIRCYAEAGTRKELNKLIKLGLEKLL